MIAFGTFPRAVRPSLRFSPTTAALNSSSICARCLLRTFSRPAPPQLAPQRPVSASSTSSRAPTATPWTKTPNYFLANRFLRRDDTILSPATTTTTTTDTPPHRRRQRRARSLDPNDPAYIPPDASFVLSTSAAASSSTRRQALSYLALSKPRLTALIVLTTMASYALFPVDPLLSSPAAPTLSTLTLAYLSLGTALSSASANALNMAFEPHLDSRMSRTRNRPLVRGLLSKFQAIAFATVTGVTGVTALHLGVNPTVAALGALNIALYAGVYTPMKRLSVANTWVGAVVGGIPPLMGWAAAAGAVATEGDAFELLSHPGGWLLAALLFAWQFPHFNALSYAVRDEYRRAGFQMAVWKYPGMNARVALRYSLSFFPICAGLWWYGVTDMGFLLSSSVVNAWLTKEAWRFWREGGEKGRARALFWVSVWHLPLLLGLAMVHKAGLWRGAWERVVGVEEGEEGEE